jgi:hypothetical protein
MAIITCSQAPMSVTPDPENPVACMDCGNCSTSIPYSIQISFIALVTTIVVINVFDKFQIKDADQYLLFRIAAPTIFVSFIMSVLVLVGSLFFYITGWESAVISWVIMIVWFNWDRITKPRPIRISGKNITSTNTTNATDDES